MICENCKKDKETKTYVDSLGIESNICEICFGELKL